LGKGRARPELSRAEIKGEGAQDDVKTLGSFFAVFGEARDLEEGRATGAVRG